MQEESCSLRIRAEEPITGGGEGSQGGEEAMAKAEGPYVGMHLSLYCDESMIIILSSEAWVNRGL